MIATRATARRAAATVLVPAVLALGALGTTRAQDSPAATSWDEPSLEDVLTHAKLIVRGRVLGAVAADDDAPKIVLERTIVGKPPEGDSLTFGGVGTAASASPNVAGASTDAIIPALKTGDDVILVLDEVASPAPGKPRYRLPTPSFGRFTVTNGRVLGAPRDSFMRVDLPVADFEQFLVNASAVARGEKADVAWLASARAALAKLDATADASVAPAHLALESLCLGATEADAELGLRYFGSSELQLRLSATRLLMKSGGERAASGLLRLAIGDSEPAVRTLATFAVARVKPTPDGAVHELASHVRDASATPVHLANGPKDPRRSELASNLSAALEALRALDAERAAVDAAIELLAKDDDETLAAVCFFLHRARPIGHLRLIALKMRDPDSPYPAANRFISDLLKKITNAPIGVERDRWLTWLDMNRDLYPATPPPPGKK